MTDPDALTALAVRLGTIMDNFTSGAKGGGHDFALRSAMVLAIIGAYPEKKGRAAMTKDLYDILPSSCLSTIRSRFTRCMNLLQEKGYIIIRKSTTDARGHEFVITPAGSKALDEIAPQ